MSEVTSGSANLPDGFAARLRQIVPPEWVARCLRSYGREAGTSFRVNALKADADEVVERLREAGLTPSSIAAFPHAYQISGEQRSALSQSELCRAGHVYLQNPSSMAPPMVLDPQPGEHILDLAAAPGGKTLHMADMMENRGRIAAVESVRPRFFKMREILERGGVKIAETYLKDGTTVWRNCPETFDRVLLDAPCSGEGRFRTGEPSTYAYWSVKKIREMARKQKRLLFSAVQCLKPGGVLVYATCTMAPEENEAVIQRSLRRFGEALQLETIRLPLENVCAGLTRWAGRELHGDLWRTVRILPQDGMAGFFIARMRKTASTLGQD